MFWPDAPIATPAALSLAGLPRLNPLSHLHTIRSHSYPDAPIASSQARYPVVVFSHGHFLRVLAARWVGQPVAFARSLLLSTASVSALGFDHGKLDEPAIALWNDDRHLTR